MYELVELIYNLKNKPLNIIVLAVCFFIAEKLGRNFITSQVKRLFHTQDRSEFQQYIANQKRIEAELLYLMESQGIKWKGHGLESQTSDIRTNSSKLSKLYSEGKETMKKINKALLLPLLSAIALFVKEAFGYNISDDMVNTSADVILYLIMFAGLFIHPKKDKTNDSVFLQEGGE